MPLSIFSYPAMNISIQLYDTEHMYTYVCTYMNVYVLNIQMYMHMYIVCKNAAMYNQTMYTTQYGT